MGYINYSDIYNLCRKHSSMSESDIEQLENISKALLQDEVNSDKDVFIDIKDEIINQAVVVFHRLPKTVDSLYNDVVVGKTAFSKDEPGPLRTLDTGQHSQGLYAQTQEGIVIKQDVYPIVSNSRIIGVIIIEENIGEKVKESYDLFSTQQRIPNNYNAIGELLDPNKIIYENIDEGILIFNEKSELVYHNSKANEIYRSFGYRNKIKGQSYDNLTLDKYSFDYIKKYFEDGQNSNLDRLVKVYNRNFKIKTLIERKKGNFFVILSELPSVTSKESMSMLDNIEIQEIHHRVKNNLQAIVSILRLQSNQSTNPETRKVLMDSVNRVLAIAATHEILSSQKNNKVKLDLIMKHIIDNISRVYHNDFIKLHLNISSNIYLDSNKAVTLSMIVNEIIQNCYDHAFDASIKSPEITVLVEKHDNSITVVIEDNGKGFSENVENKSSLGLKIVQSYVEEKLQGDILLDSHVKKGSKVKIKFDI